MNTAVKRPFFIAQLKAAAAYDPMLAQLVSFVENEQNQGIVPSQGVVPSRSTTPSVPVAEREYDLNNLADVNAIFQMFAERSQARYPRTYRRI